MNKSKVVIIVVLALIILFSCVSMAINFMSDKQSSSGNAIKYPQTSTTGKIILNIEGNNAGETK